MSLSRRILAGTGAAAIIAAATFGGAMSAVAHSGSFFTVEHGGDQPKFAKISNTATMSPLPASILEYPSGIEIWEEQGYAVIGGGEGGYPSVALWNHNTGELGTPVPLTVAPEFADAVVSVWALDTTKGSTLPDGTLITLVELLIEDGEFPIEVSYVASVALDGTVTPLVDLTSLEAQEDDLYLNSLATDPTSGISYVFFDYDRGGTYYSVLDFSTGTAGEPVELEGVRSSLGDGWMTGADFTDAGVLGFFHSSGVFASLEGAPSPSVTAVSHGGPDMSYGEINLAWDPAVLAATGVDATAPTAIALGLLLLGGGALVFAMRRRTA